MPTLRELAIRLLFRGRTPRRSRSRWRPSLESLGSRCLLSAITEFPIPTDSSAPDGIAAGPDGNIWFTENSANQVGQIAPDGTILAEIPVPTDASGPELMTPGPIDTDPNSIWFSENSANTIARIDLNGNITEFPLPQPDSQPDGITAGPDGNLWFTEFGRSQIGMLTPDGQFAEYDIPSGNHGVYITPGPDGNLWFTEAAASKIGKISTDGTVTEYDINAGSGVFRGIQAGPDGNIWFNDWFGNAIMEIDTSGNLLGNFPVPTPDSQPSGFALGADGNFWFGELSGNNICRITLDGTITEFPIPTPGASPSQITAGSDGNIWFTEYSVNQIARVDLSAVPPALTRIGPETAIASVSVGSSVFPAILSRNVLVAGNHAPEVNVTQVAQADQGHVAHQITGHSATLTPHPMASGDSIDSGTSSAFISELTVSTSVF
jgi:virginiamycin B lyase